MLAFRSDRAGGTMETRTAKVVAGVGVLGSLASVAALFMAPGAAPSTAPVAASATVPAAAPQPAVVVRAEPEGPQKLRLPPVSNLLFSEARELLLRQGWFPLNSPINPTGNEELLSGNGPYFVELGYREMLACSGTGLAPCKFAYRSEAGQYLTVITVGEAEMARVNDLWISDRPDEQAGYLR